MFCKTDYEKVKEGSGLEARLHLMCDWLIGQLYEWNTALPSLSTYIQHVWTPSHKHRPIPYTCISFPLNIPSQLKFVNQLPKSLNSNNRLNQRSLSQVLFSLNFPIVFFLLHISWIFYKSKEFYSPNGFYLGRVDGMFFALESLFSVPSSFPPIPYPL